MVKVVAFILAGLAVGMADPTGVDQAPQPQEDTRTAEHLGQLKNIRDGLLDPEVRPENRRRFADLLFSYDSLQARTLIVELLGLTQNPDVQRALCAVIADRARRTPERLDESYVAPLLDLLDAAAEDLRLLAARALADFPGAEAPRRLGRLAAQDDAPLAKRLAAIDALAPNTHRREVVGQLVALLESKVPEIQERVVACLEPAARRSLGSDPNAWRRWWEEESKLSDEAWAAEQLQIYRDRYRQTADELRSLREETRREHETLVSRLRGLQRDLFRVLNAEQREARLLEWLDDPLPAVKLAALTIVKARMADEGKRPEGKLLEALLGLLRRGSPEVRREVLEIVQNLNNPAAVEAVLAQLEQETDLPTRQALFKAIGKLASPATIPALIREISGSGSPPECVREAAVALGRVAAANPGTDLRDAAAALKNRYRSTPGEDYAMRAALLTAMAGMADPTFTPEFLEALEQDNGSLLSPAIGGLLSVRDASRLPRLRSLMAHADPLVRVAAVEAVGQLGREEADLEGLLTRLNRAVETNEHARDAAWRGLRQLLSNRPMPERIAVAERLRDIPDLQITYLSELADAQPKLNGGSADLETVLDRLAAALVSQGRHGEAVGPLRRLYAMHVARPGSRAEEYARRLLEAALRSPANTPVAEVIEQLAAGAASESAKIQIVDTVAQYLDSPEATADSEQTRLLISALRSVPSRTFGEPWTQMLERAATRLQPANGNAAPSSPHSE